MGQFIGVSIAVFLVIILVLVAMLLIAKKYLSPSGKVTITVNGDKKLEVEQGGSLLSTLNDNGIHLSSACGGKGSCGQCRLQVLEGGGEILDTEKGHFSRKEIKEHWRLGCQTKVKGNLSVKVSDSILNVKEWECTVISNKNVSSFIKEFKVALPLGEHMDFIPGSYAQIAIPAYDTIDYDKDFDKSLIGDEYIGAWKKFNILSLKAHNPEPTIRAYSMANYPAEGDIITLTVRIASTPFLPRPQVGFQDVPTGIGSSYIFSLKPGDKVRMSGPYGDFHPKFDSKREMIWIGGGAGMAPLRSQIMYMTRQIHCTDRDAFLKMDQVRRRKAAAFQTCLRKYIRQKRTGGTFAVRSRNVNKAKTLLWIAKCRKHPSGHFHSRQVAEPSAVLDFIYNFLVCIHFSSFVAIISIVFFENVIFFS